MKYPVKSPAMRKFLSAACAFVLAAAMVPSAALAQVGADAQVSAQVDAASQVDTFAVDQLIAQETAGPIGPGTDAFANNTTNATSSELYAELEAKEAAYDEAEAKLDKLALSLNCDEFFRDMGSADAFGKLTGKTFSGSAYYGARSDEVQMATVFSDSRNASNVVQVAIAIAMIERVNDLRESIGMSRLLVTDYNMAWEQTNVNWSAGTVGHSDGCGAENLAWGYPDPVEGWYYQEKAAFDEFYELVTGSKCTLVGADAYNWLARYLYDNGSGVYNSFLSEKHMTIGHYLNMIDPSYRTLGMAYTPYALYGDCSGQSFGRSAVGASFTDAQYKTRFENWLVTKYRAAGFSASAAATRARNVMAIGEVHMEYARAYYAWFNYEPTTQEIVVSKRTAAVNYNGSITKAAYPIKAIKTAEGELVQSATSDGKFSFGPGLQQMPGVTFTKVGGSKYLKITTTGANCGHNTGKVTVAPKTPVGEYKIKVRIDAPATRDYLASSKVVTLTVQVKRFTPTITVTSKVSPNKKYSATKAQTVTMIKAVQCAAKPLTYSIVKVMDGEGVRVPDKIAAKFSCDPATGVVTFAKGTPRGKYKVLFKIESPAVAGYNYNWRTATGTFRIV